MRIPTRTLTLRVLTPTTACAAGATHTHVVHRVHHRSFRTDLSGEEAGSGGLRSQRGARWGRKGGARAGGLPHGHPVTPRPCCNHYPCLIVRCKACRYGRGPAALAGVPGAKAVTVEEGKFHGRPRFLCAWVTSTRAYAHSKAAVAVVVEGAAGEVRYIPLPPVLDISSVTGSSPTVVRLTTKYASKPS